MLKINLVTESFLFKNNSECFRAVPFYNLAFNELIIYEDGKVKYFIDMNNKVAPVVQIINEQTSRGKDTDQVIRAMGRSINRNWTTRYSIIGEEVKDSYQTETVQLHLLTDLAELA